jgi:hypothetical protein
MRHQHLLPILRLPRLRDRLLNRVALRHVAGWLLGFLLCLTGSFLATHPGLVESVPHVVWDAFSYSIHGIGLIPLAKNIEPLWAIVTGGD